MALQRYEIEKFDGKVEFGLWKTKVKAILGQQKHTKATEDPSRLPKTLTEDEKEVFERLVLMNFILKYRKHREG